jgi:hypothetical protein
MGSGLGAGMVAKHRSFVHKNKHRIHPEADAVLFDFKSRPEKKA